MLQTGTDTLTDPSEGRTTTNQERISFYGDQRGFQQDPVSNKGAGVLDIPGDLEARTRKAALYLAQRDSVREVRQARQ